jgi:hypothetical protein
LTRLAKEAIACAAGGFNGVFAPNYADSVRRAKVFQPTVRWMQLSVRCLSLAVLLTLSIAIQYLSPQCGFAGEKTTDDAETPTETKAERPPFDLTYLPLDAMGVVAVRPSVIFSDPAMKPLAGMANECLTQMRQFLKLSGEPNISIEDIEEIIGHITIVPGDKKHGRNHSLMAGLTMIRATHDFDWLKLMRQLDPKTEEVRHDDRVYYRSHFSQLAPPKMSICYFMPDNRTLAFLPEKTLSAFVNGGSVQRPHFSWDEDWKRVERGLIAVAMDNRWANGLSKEQLVSKEQLGGEAEWASLQAEWASLAQNAATEVAGVDWKNGIDFQAFLHGKDSAAGDRIAEGIKAIVAQVRRGIDQPLEDVPEDERQETAFHLQMSKDLFDHVRIRQCESTVRVYTTAKIKLADFAKYFFKEATHEPKLCRWLATLRRSVETDNASAKRR